MRYEKKANLIAVCGHVYCGAWYSNNVHVRHVFFMVPWKDFVLRAALLMDVLLAIAMLFSWLSFVYLNKLTWCRRFLFECSWNTDLSSVTCRVWYSWTLGIRTEPNASKVSLKLRWTNAIKVYDSRNSIKFPMRNSRVSECITEVLFIASLKALTITERCKRDNRLREVITLLARCNV